MDRVIPFLRKRLYLIGPIDPNLGLGEPIECVVLNNPPSRIHACYFLLDSVSSEWRVDLNIVAEIDSIMLFYDFAAAPNA
jgi:hypothetical protein